MLRTRSMLLGGALASVLAWEPVLAAGAASVTVTADMTQLRMNVGESYSVDYRVQVTNEGPEHTGLNVWDTPPTVAGLTLTSDNLGRYPVTVGSHEVDVTQVLTASAPGRYSVTLSAALDDDTEVQEASVQVVVSADADRDGVADDLDRCPSSAAHAIVGPDGCAPAQSRTADFVTIQLGSGPNALVLRTSRANVGSEFWTEGGVWGFNVKGTLLIASPLGDIPMYEADVLFEYGQSKLAGIQRLRGRAQVPFPTLGPLAGAEIKRAAMAELGLDYGRNLAYLAAPLLAERQYLFFNFDAGLEVDAGALQFKAPGGVQTTFLLDPLDPFFYFRGEMPELPGVGELGEMGIGFSLQGLIPYQAKTTQGVPPDVTRFQGHLLLAGTIPFKHLALELDGDMVGRFDPNPEFGKSPLAPPLLVQYGGNGKLNVGFDLGDLAGKSKKSDNSEGASGNDDAGCDEGNLLRCLSVSLALGDASLGIKLDNLGQNAYVSGLLSPENPLSEIVPVVPRTEVQVAGLISSDLAKSFLKGQGEYAIGASNLGKLIGVQLGDLQATQATMTLNAIGLRIQGRSASQIHPSVGIGGLADVDLRLTGDPKTWYLRMAGDLGINGVPLSTAAKLSIDGTGLRVEGAVVTPLSRIAMAGAIDARGVNVSGKGALDLPLGPPPGAFDQAKVDIGKAQREVRKIDAEIERQRQIVRAERERDAQRLRDAQAAVTAAQAKVNGLQNDINYNHSRIAARKSEIGSWRAWYDNKPWYDKAWAWTVLVYESAWRSAEIASRATAIAALEVSRAVAIAALELAKQTLRGFEAAAVVTPIDLDPRVAALFVARDTTILVLEGAKQVLVGLEQLKGRLRAALALRIGSAGLSGDVQGQACWADSCYPLGGGRVAIIPQPLVCVTIPVVGGEVCAKF